MEFPQITKKGFVILILVAIISVALGRFTYFNFIEPYPYRHELKSCLEQARVLDTEAEMKAAEDQCFRIYPHFN